MNPTVTKILNHLLYHSDIDSRELIELSEYQLIRAYQFHIDLLHDSNDILHAFNDHYVTELMKLSENLQYFRKKIEQFPK